MTTNPIHPRAAQAVPAVIATTVGAGLKKPLPGKSHWLKPLAILCCMVNAASADTVGTFGLFTYTDNGTSITITDYPTSATGAVVIPAKIPPDTGKPVTSIGSAFYGCTGITSVTIPSSVTSIGGDAFYYCLGLTSVTIPASMTRIGGDAFLACNLSRVYFLGDAPMMDSEAFGAWTPMYYLNGKTGFTTPVWLNYYYNVYPGVPPQFTSAPPLSTGIVGTAYNFTCTASGTPSSTFTVSAGALPDGLAITSYGVISGTPTKAGIFTGTITASNGIAPDATQNFTIHADEYRSVVASGSNGTVTGGGSYLLNSTATLTAVPDFGYAFTGWIGAASGTANPLSLLMDADKTIGANFTRQYTLTLGAVSSGTVSGIAVDGKYLTGTTATLTAVPAAGYVFTGWTGAATGTTNPLSLLMDADKAVGATFVAGVGMLVDGQLATGEVVQRGPLTVTMQTLFPNGVILYTLDGSAPSLGSALYTGPLTIGLSCTVRAVAYSSDFSSQAQSPPLAVVIVPTLTSTTNGGGSVGVQPPDGAYSSGSMATLTATPAAGWTFLQWLGDTTGTNPVTSVQMTRNKCVQAVFGTTVTTTTVGSGSIWQSPVAASYPYGTRIRFSGLPASGNYLALWGNAASGTANPLDFLVTTPNPTLTAVFQPLGTGQFALALVADGGGKVVASPAANKYGSGANVRLTAQPDLGQDFVGWSGSAAGSVNPLTVTMNQSKAITAVFTKRPGLQVGTSLEGLVEDGFRLTLTGEFGQQYEILGSADLVNWIQAGTLTNVYGTSQLTDGGAINQPCRFYRAVILNP